MANSSLVDVAFIHPHPDNVRKEIGDVTEMAESMRSVGVLQPLVVQLHPTRQGHYQLLIGHRRLAAAKASGRWEVPVIVRHGVHTRAQALIVMLVENIHQAGLSPIERAEAVESLIEDGYTQKDIAKKTGLSASTISGYKTLLELDATSRDRVRTGTLTAGEAIAEVRRVRQAERARCRATGTPAPARRPQARAWEPDHLTRTHPLGTDARRRCTDERHTLRHLVGDIACGECWEAVIRADERARQTVLSRHEDDALLPA